MRVLGTAIIHPAAAVYFFFKKWRKTKISVFPENQQNGELAVFFGTWARGVTDGFQKGLSVFCVLPFVSRLSTVCRR
jgi:hypothetical protein